MLILVKISKLLFEPIAITAALGGVILLWQLWQAHRHYVFAVTLYGLCFMLGWRSLCGTGSSRYSAALILPGIVLSVYCIFKVSECLQKRYRLPLLITFWGLLLLLGGACILKLCRFNRYDATEIQVGKLIAGDAERYHEPYLLGKQERLLRYCYYSGIPGRPLDFGNDDACDIPVLCSDLAAYRQLPGAYYVMLELPPRELEELQKLWSGSDHVVLSRTPVDNHRKKFRVLWRYEPFQPRNSLSDSSAERELLKGGDMEKLRLPTEDWQQKLSNEGITFFQTSPRNMPSPWTALIPGRHIEAEVEADSKNPIAGQYSLRVKGTYPLMVMNEHALPVKTQTISFLARGVPGSEFSILLQHRSPGKPYRNEYLGHFRVMDEQTRQYLVSCSPPSDDNRNGSSLLVIKLNHGEVWFDHFHGHRQTLPEQSDRKSSDIVPPAG